MRARPWMILGSLALALSVVVVVATEAAQRRNREAEALAEPFRGITSDGSLLEGLFPIRATGVSTAPVREAAERFLATLSPEQLETTTFPIDSDEWRRWNNVHRYNRQGIGRAEMSEEQESAAFDLLRAGLRAKGLVQARDIMRLNETIREMTQRWDEYGEGLYYFTVMGAPSETEPWGWQLDGHHLIINYFVLGDQVVMTPAFWGSEPVHAETGKYAATRVFEAEEAKGLALAQSLTHEQLAAAVLAPAVPRGIFTAAFRDNFEMRYEGLPARELDERQTRLLRELIQEYVGNMRDEHAAVRMRQVEAHLDETWFAWMGGRGRRRCLLLPGSQSGAADRVRPPGRNRAANRRPDAKPHPHGSAHAQRQRLRQGSPAPAPRALRPHRRGAQALASGDVTLRACKRTGRWPE